MTWLHTQFILFIWLFCVASAHATQDRLVPIGDLTPQDKHVRSIKLLNHILTTNHYVKNIELNDALSLKIMNNYIKALDKNRSWFTKADIDEFITYQSQLDDYIKLGDLSVPYMIFKRYRHRINENADKAIGWLDYDFNFSRNEDYAWDRSEMSWANSDELNEIWRLRVKNDMLNLKLAKKSPEEIKDTLRKRYQRLKTSVEQLNSNDIFQLFSNAYTTVFDPHTAYFSPRTSENFDISMRLSLEGIGAVLKSENEYTEIVKIITGGPADLSRQIKPKDRIIGVGQGKDGKIQDVIGWRLDDVVDQIRGTKGTELRLLVLTKKSGYEVPGKVVSLVRNKIKLEEQAASSSVLEIDNTKIGVINVPTFYVDFAAQANRKKDYKSTTRDVKKLLKALQKQDISGVIIDMRENGGGSLSEALELTGLFIDQGPIVQTRDAAGKVNVNYDPDAGIVYSGPLAILVDRYCASACEIFSGAIQDHQRGIIIGEATFGKGTVQQIVDLNQFVNQFPEDHGKLKLTIAQFYRISGGSNQHKGVIPDIVFPLPQAEGEQGERALKNAIPWDKVDPTKYIVSWAPVDYFPAIKEKHRKRIQDDELFQLFLEERQFEHDNSQKKNITLVEKKRKQEKNAIMKKQREIQNKILVAQGLEPLPEDIEEFEKDENNLDETTEEPETLDVLLNETALILIDLIIPVANNTVKESTDSAHSIKAI